MIPWSSPVPAFGSPAHSRVATLGLNPSSREFVDEKGNELDGPLRRFHTLRSLGLSRWADADADDLRQMERACCDYFEGHPYDAWFRRLDGIVSGTCFSYYSNQHPACHLDLVPFATRQKWGNLDLRARRRLLALAADSLAELLRESAVQTLILNGESVVRLFQDAAEVKLDRRMKAAWSLPRKNGRDIAGYSYAGVVTEFHGVPLDRQLLILGYNHNIQSSFGVTTKVVRAIRQWIARRTQRGGRGASTQS